MAHVFIPSQLRELAGGLGEVVVEGRTLRQVVLALENRFPALAGRLRQGDGLAPGLAADVDGALAEMGLLTAVAPDSEIHFLPAIAGGSPSRWMGASKPYRLPMPATQV